MLPHHSFAQSFGAIVVDRWAEFKFGGMFKDIALAASYRKFCQLGGTNLSSASLSSGVYGALKLERVDSAENERERDENADDNIPTPKASKKKTPALKREGSLVDTLKPSASVRLASLLGAGAMSLDADSKKLRIADAETAGFQYNEASAMYTVRQSLSTHLFNVHPMLPLAYCSWEMASHSRTRSSRAPSRINATRSSGCGIFSPAPARSMAASWVRMLTSLSSFVGLKNHAIVASTLSGDDMGLGKTFQV